MLISMKVGVSHCMALSFRELPAIVPCSLGESSVVLQRTMRWIFRFLVGAGIATALTGGLPHPALAGTELYVSAEESGEIVVIDVDRGEAVARVAVGKRPRGVKLSRDGKLLYVALSGSPRAAPGVDESKLPPPDRAADGVGVVDLASRKLVRTYASGPDPESFDLSRDGKTLYVSNEDAGTMSALDLATGKVTGKVAIGGEPEGVTLRPDGKAIYVTSEQENQVVAIDTKKLSVSARIPTGPRPRAIVFSRDGKTGFVTCENGGGVTVFDAVKNAAAGTIKIEAVAKTPLGPRPMGAAVSPDGKHVFVSNGRGESVAIIDVAGRKVARLVDGVGARPWGIAVSADGKKVYTANGPSNDVSVVDVATGKVEKRIKVGGLPWGIALR
jgi:YVTN family beta-propeller protein